MARSKVSHARNDERWDLEVKDACMFGNSYWLQPNSKCHTRNEDWIQVKYSNKQKKDQQGKQSKKHPSVAMEDPV